jgi:glycosyltransferase involved in cell wall biosynthesis
MHFVNSNYSESTTRKYYEGRLHAKMHLLYPPVNLQAWHAPKGAASRKGVISVARFSPWKRHDMQLQIVGNDIPLTMIGGARAPLEIETVRSLSKITSDNVRILVGSPIQNLKRLLWSSKVFLHTADNEPFGLSIVEAIAAGCVPVIRRSGGAAEIVPIPELTFTSTRGATEIVEKALAGDYDRYLPQLSARIAKFDESVFCREFLSAIGRVHN